MSSSYESEDLVANKLQAGTNLINEGDFLVKDKVGVVTSLKDEGALKVAVPETLPKDVADDQLPIVGMKSIFKKVLKCLKKEEEEEEEEEEDYDDHYHDDDDDDYNYDYDKEEDDDVGIIGVYGMGGVGKTTLLKQIKKKLLQMKNDFDFVIWVVDLQHDKIQLQIGEQIGLFDNKVWEDKNFEDKASDIFKILEEKKFVLLMDGLWERVDLTKVGVPLPDPENSSKIVFSTRSLQICSLMEADKLFKVKCLRYREAWKLFKASVVDETLRSHREVWDHETLGSHLDVRDLRDVCGECRGLPLALVSIGRTMASKKTPEEWSDVLGVLRRSTTSYSGLDDQLKKDIRDNLKLSYYNLQNDMFKSCFLYCCLFPRELEIKKGDLIDYWIGEGFLDESLGAVQSQGHYIIDVFLSVCLLEQSGKDDSSVKMHHWIHDMSLWIASKIETEEGNCFFCPDTYNFKDDIKEAQVIRDNLAKATRISLRNDKVMEMLRDPPRCPLLQTLFLIRNGSDVISEDHFFNVMPSLKVLNLSSNYWFTKLPLGISELLSLQHLDLSGTKIQELPTELRVLKILKCLNLEETRSLLKIPRQLISEFSMLHVLRLWECGFMLQPNEDTVVCNDAQLLIEELLYLKNLSMLSITLNNSHALQRLLSSNRLQSCIQSLCLRDLSHAKSIKVPLTDLKHLNTLEISNCKYLGELEVDFVGEAQAQDVRESPCSFYFLHEVIISNCRKLRELTWLILAPNLKHLRISDCEEMEEIINVGKLSKRPELMRNVTPFSKLKFLTLTNLPKLRSIYWTDLPFPDLKAKPNITGCPDSLVPPRLLKSAIAYLPQLQMPTATGKQSSRGFFAKEKLNIELGFGDGAGAETYPERPEEADCIHYLRTGFCRYGSRCRFNHPRERGTVMGAARATGGDFPERADQPICQYFMRTGTCKFGASCKYHHPRQGAGSVSHVSLNLYGYPLRPGDKECSYYLKTEKCKFGATCKFHHPQPASYVYLPYPGSVNPVASPGTQPTVGSSSIYGIHPQLSASAAAYPGSYQSMPISVGLSSSNRKEFPERPGQPECQYFLRTGDCKHGSSCRYHHPREVIVPKPDAVLSPLGLPSRPGAPLCIFYAQHGICKFGPACKFDHPVAPYPVGASIGTLAPSSSSSDLRPELISGSSKDSATTRMSSTISTSSGSVGSIFSKSGPVPHSSMQQSMQSFGPSTTGGNGSSTEARTSSLFPENHSISRKELIECWISEGILEGRNGMQNEGYRNINDLVRACLLEEAEDNCVKMHDVIRDMAMWIATKVEKENEGFFVRTGVELTEIPKIDEWESIRRMSVIKNKIESLAMIPRCPRLKTLFLNSYNLKTISGNFFQSMPSLTVLNLSDNPLTNLPSDISTLVSLQHLDLSCTAIKELPQELESLRELKCLNLEHTCQLQTIPRRLISNFSKLQVLRLWEFGSSGQAPEDSILFNGAESLTEELLCLQHLNMLSITIKSDHAFETFFKSKKLQNCTQSLCIQSLPQQNCLNALVVDLKQMDTLKIMDYKCLAELQLDCSADMGSIRESSWFSKPSHSQHKLLPKIERLAWLVLAPNLKCLVVSSCSNIKDIICDKKIVDIPEKIRKTIPFKKLEFLDLQRLQNLKSIYWNAMSFRHLKEIKVIQCPKLS